MAVEQSPPSRRRSPVKRRKSWLRAVAERDAEPNLCCREASANRRFVCPRETGLRGATLETAAMSRLDSFIRRMHAQRTCLDYAARLITALPGNVLEFGLGNGRTYDHLRERLPTRDVFVFDRQLAAHPACIPAGDRLFLGDVHDTLPRAVTVLGRNTALANVDIGSGDDRAVRELLQWMTPLLLRLLKPDAVIVSGQSIQHSSLTPLPPPFALKPGRYFLYSPLDGGNTEAKIPFRHDTRRRERTFALVNK